MKALLATTLILFASTSWASCVGSGSVSVCYDAQTGNSYTVTRAGNTTFTQGSNAATGSNWSQDSISVGNTTLHSGRAADGNSWSGSSHTFGSTTIHSGTDSRGNPYSKTCTAWGCY